MLHWKRAQSFYNKREELEALGFPPKLPGINGRSPAAVMRWIETNGETNQPARADSRLDRPATTVNALERRYAR